jgi:hypothetical protein
MLRHLIPFAFCQFTCAQWIGIHFSRGLSPLLLPSNGAWRLVKMCMKEWPTDRQTHSMAPAHFLFCLYPPHIIHLCVPMANHPSRRSPQITLCHSYHFIHFLLLSLASIPAKFKKSLGLCENPRRRRQRNKSPPMGLRNKTIEFGQRA